MTLTCNLHQPNRAMADTSGGHSWIEFCSDEGHVTIFMPLKQAQACADAFNAHVPQKEAAE